MHPSFLCRPGDGGLEKGTVCWLILSEDIDDERRVQDQCIVMRSRLDGRIGLGLGPRGLLENNGIRTPKTTIGCPKRGYKQATCY